MTGARGWRQETDKEGRYSRPGPSLEGGHGQGEALRVRVNFSASVSSSLKGGQQRRPPRGAAQRRPDTVIVSNA